MKGKYIIIVHPTYQKAKQNWERHRKFKWFFYKASWTSTKMILWDIFGNEWDFVIGCKSSVRGHRAEMWYDEFIPPIDANTEF